MAEKPEEKKVEAPAAEEKKEGAAKTLKIGQMSMAQLDKEIENTKKHMGGLTSQYGRMLTARKRVLAELASGKK